ncbi:Microtubule-associated protein 1S, partial [Saguinus oedipus]
RARRPSPPHHPPTVTTPSLPTEVASPHSTEVDEALSVSFELVLPPSAPTSEAGLSLPLREPRAPGSAFPHDVDLCLVSPYEFEHRKAVNMAPAPASPGSSNDSNAGSQERTGQVPLAPGAADSEEETEAFRVTRHDPLPDPLKVPPPPPDPSSISMADPGMLPPKTARQTEDASRTRKPLSRPTPRAATPKATPVAAAKTKGLAGGDRATQCPE